MHAGHGMDYKTAKVLSKVKEIEEFNIGHFIIGESITFGLKATIGKFKKSDAIVVGSACCKAIADSIKKKHSPAIKLGKMVKRLKGKIL